MSTVTIGFSLDPVMVPLGDILPSRTLTPGTSTSRKFAQIKSSIDAIGLIEPLSVTTQGAPPAKYLLLDGHLRLAVLGQLKHARVPCLIASDDESYTYNNRVNRLSAIQEHLMIRRAVERGVSTERLAKVLCVDVSHILKKLNLLDGICPEAATLLKERHFSPELARVLRKMKPTRQVECAELLIATNNLTVGYAEALLVATPQDLLVEGRKPKKMDGVTPEQMARMEREMANLQGQYQVVVQTFGEDVLNLVLARGYLVKLIDNAQVTRYLSTHEPEVLEHFKTIAASVSLEQ
jgi:ParB-like chromosome segregation protein Spo0J